MANDIGGVWRTIGGRRVFIKEGQDLASAMKESGKFKSNQKAKDSIRKIGDTDINQLQKLAQRVRDKNDSENIKAVGDYENGAIDREELLKRFDGNEDKMKEAFEKMGYTAPTKENIDKANTRHEEFMSGLKDKGKSREDIDREFWQKEDSFVKNTFGENSKEYKKYKESHEKAYGKNYLTSEDNDDYEYNLYKQAKENPDSINPMTEMSTDWEDLDKRFKDRYEKENQKSDLMTAEQLKGKDREEQKEINKQYLKEQNKLAQEKALAKGNKERDKESSRIFNAERDLKIGDTYIDGRGDLNIVVDRPLNDGNMVQRKLTKLFVPGQKDIKGTKWEVKKIRSASKEDYDKYPSVGNHGNYGKSKENDNQFTMYNSQYDKEVTVKKGADGKWVDSDGNKYMGYLSKQDVKQYFKGNWKESTEKRTASEIISSQMSKTKNAKIEVANALGLKYDNDNGWKSTSQLYKEQKGKDIVNIAIDSGKADKYNAFVKKNYNREDKNFSDRANIDKYAKDNNLDADALYYMTKIASESDRTKLKKKAFELYKKQHPNTKKTIYSFEDDIK